MIKYKGFQVLLAELEGILVKNDVIDDVAVIRVYSEEHRSKVPRAYVVRSSKSKSSGVSESDKAAKLLSWMNTKVSQHKRLCGGIRFVDKIPKSVSGKILRRILKEHARNEQKAATAKL